MPAPDSSDLADLYVYRLWSTHRISEKTGLSRRQVTRLLRDAGVTIRPRGTGRPRQSGKSGDLAELSRVMRELYESSRLGSPQIAQLLGIPERTVRDRLRRDGIAARTRGGWNREDRATIPADVLDLLYTRLGMTAAEVGERLGLSANAVLRSAHALGVPVRSVNIGGPAEIELVSALYGDQLVDGVLTAHGVPRVPAGGSLSERFPVPVPLATPLVKDLYWGCGVSVNHIELLTGQPAQTVLGFMHRAGIPRRHPGGRCPFLRRWREGSLGGAGPARPRAGQREENQRRGELAAALARSWRRNRRNRRRQVAAGTQGEQGADVREESPLSVR